MCIYMSLCVCVPGLGKSPGEWIDNQLQYSYMENFIDIGIWQTTYSSCSHKDLDTTEQLTLSLPYVCICTHMHTCIHTYVCVCMLSHSEGYNGHTYVSVCIHT